MRSLQDVIELNSVKMCSYWIRVGPNPVTSVFIKEMRGRLGHRDTKLTEKKAMGQWRQRLE